MRVDAPEKNGQPLRSLTRPRLLVIAASVASGLALTTVSHAGDVVALDELPHIHGIVVDRTDPRRLYLATHSGLFIGTPQGLAMRIGASTDDLMGFAVHPSEQRTLYASGHPSTGGNLGFIRSQDGGRTWRQLATGVGGPVDFHAMTVSNADANVIYGVFQGLQVSRDGGRTWNMAGSLPEGLYDLAASAVDPERLYAATGDGLMMSTDAGVTWRLAYFLKRPASMVHVTSEGMLYAFVLGAGLVRSKEPTLAWTKVASDFADRALIHLADDPAVHDRLYAIADTGAILMSRDGGSRWTSYEGSHRESGPMIARGRELYEESCQSCHGVRGVGERPDDMYATDEYGFVAPPLDDSAHAWHHSDRDLVNAILHGSPRNERMIAWRQTLSRENAEDLVAYIKSLWNFRSLACQGARHMRCMH